MPRSKVFDIVLIVFGVILLGSAGFAWYYFFQQNQTLDATSKQLKTDIAVAVNKLQELQQLRLKSPEFEAEKVRMTGYIPNRQEQADFIYELEQLGDKCQIKVKSCTLNQTPVTNPSIAGYQFYDWKISMTGSYQGLLSFLDEIPKSKRMAVISDLQTNAVFDENKNNYRLDVNLSLELVTNVSQVSQEKVKQ
jgi:Tfp pilus assembly protein PilO